MTWRAEKQAYSFENSVRASMAAQVLSMIYLKKIREDAGAAYSCGAQASFSRNDFGTQTQITAYCPVISEELAELLIKKKIKMLGMDMPSPDNGEFEIHKKLFENEIFILENLTNLNKLLYNEEIQIFAQPLKIQGEASLVRAIAVYKGY